MMSSEPGRTIEATKTSLAIVEEIRRQDGATLTELAEALDVAKSTLYAHLETLEEVGYVVRDGTTYHVALKFLHFGEYARNRDPNYTLAREQVYALSNEANEEVDFTVEENGRLVSLYHSVGKSSNLGMQVGSYFYMHNTAAGKAIMAEWPDDRVEDVIDQWGLPADTEHTITDREVLYEELESTAERGYGVSDQELMEGFRSIGATAHTPDGDIFGALSIGGPTYRLNVDGAPVEMLLESVEQIERSLESDTRDPTDWWGQYFEASK